MKIKTNVNLYNMLIKAINQNLNECNSIKEMIFYQTLLAKYVIKTEENMKLELTVSNQKIKTWKDWKKFKELM